MVLWRSCHDPDPRRYVTNVASCKLNWPNMVLHFIGIVYCSNAQSIIVNKLLLSPLHLGQVEQRVNLPVQCSGAVCCVILHLAKQVGWQLKNNWHEYPLLYKNIRTSCCTKQAPPWHSSMGVLLLQHWPNVPVVIDKMARFKSPVPDCDDNRLWPAWPVGRYRQGGVVWYVVPGNLALSITINNITT